MSTQTTKKLSIVEKIMRKLQLGDEGKIGSFFEKQVDKSRKAIRDLNRNKETLKNRYEDDVTDLKDKLQDAQEALNDAYENVTPEDVKSNAAMLEFESTYWAGVKSAKREVERLEKALENREKTHKEEIEAVDKEVAAHQERMDILKGK